MTSARERTAELAQQWEQEQTALRNRCEETNRVGFSVAADGAMAGLERVGGVDISYPKHLAHGAGDCAIVSLVVLSYPSLEVVYEVSDSVPIDIPYVAGYLAFREIAAYRHAFARLRREAPHMMPQVVLVDGNGTLHPRRFGSACHLGVDLDVPTVGVAKNYLHIDDLVGTDARELKHRFATHSGSDGQSRDVELVGASGVCYGMAVAPAGPTAVNPIFVSVGHRVSLATAAAVVRACSIHRIPEPIRVADQHSRALLRSIESKPTPY
ncbi:hypothetical protein IW140_000865 [Coemansia sp. RSA 1813]|nr:hypothetical protein LPJ74_002070 [Coemansia sp. RSA 1843]KAJ2217215.1 hypothetical protein EV179_000682 [Coemansia sp. RSA 487]KAJ2572414.1 hypothetical protein IW140_000865 [Coemansia sp. RSA 1813]